MLLGLLITEIGQLRQHTLHNLGSLRTLVGFQPNGCVEAANSSALSSNASYMASGIPQRLLFHYASFVHNHTDCCCHVSSLMYCSPPKSLRTCVLGGGGLGTKPLRSPVTYSPG